MSSQNHSYEVDGIKLGLGTSLEVRFKNVNDGSIEGVMHKELPIFTTQFSIWKQTLVQWKVLFILLTF